MKTVRVSKVEYLQVCLPEIPKEVILEDGTTMRIGQLKPEQIWEIGEAWTKEFIQAAQADRGAPRGR